MYNFYVCILLHQCYFDIKLKKRDERREPSQNVIDYLIISSRIINISFIRNTYTDSLYIRYFKHFALGENIISDT